MKKLSEYIFNYHRRKRQPSNKIFPAWDKTVSILLLFESDLTEKNLQIKQLIKELQQQGKEVTAWGYVDMKKAQSGILRDYRILAHEDTNFLDKPKEQHLKDLMRMHFDVLIDLSQRDILPLKYLMLYADADFKAGRQTNAPYLADFMVSTNGNDNPAYLFDQITYYLKNIQSSDK